MKKLSFVFFAVAALCASCSRSDWKSVALDDEMIEYKLQPGQYAVVVVLDVKTSLDQAKKAARHRAAQLAVSGGYRYFLIQSEVTTRVIKQQAMLDQDVKELFIEGDFGQNQLTASSMNETVFDALKVVFQCYEKKPQGRSVKACNWTDCSLLNQK